MPFAKNARVSKGQVPEEYSMSAVDVYDRKYSGITIDNGLIAWRLKPDLYPPLRTVVGQLLQGSLWCLYGKSAAFYAIKWRFDNELWKVAQREFSNWFYYQTPTRKRTISLGHVAIPQYKILVGGWLWSTYHDCDDLPTECHQWRRTGAGIPTELRLPVILNARLQDLYDKDGWSGARKSIGNWTRCA